MDGRTDHHDNRVRFPRTPTSRKSFGGAAIGLALAVALTAGLTFGPHSAAGASVSVAADPMPKRRDSSTIVDDRLPIDPVDVSRSGGCNDYWIKDGAAQSHNRSVSMLLTFLQYNNGGYNYTFVDLQVTTSKRVNGMWKATPAAYRKIYGAFAGPRSPTGYYLSNPFTTVSSAPGQTIWLTHFADVSPVSKDCYKMDNALYTAYAAFPGGSSGIGVTAEIRWSS